MLTCHRPDFDHTFSSASVEYVSNGIYNIHGELFMTVWAYRKHFNDYFLKPVDNVKITNSISCGMKCIKVIPDLGEVKEILAFQINTVKNALKNNI